MGSFLSVPQVYKRAYLLETESVTLLVSSFHVFFSYSQPTTSRLKLFRNLRSKALGYGNGAEIFFVACIQTHWFYTVLDISLGIRPQIRLSPLLISEKGSKVSRSNLEKRFVFIQTALPQTILGIKLQNLILS